MKLNFGKDAKFNDIFQPQRLYLLLQRELVHHYKTLTTAAVFGFGAVLILNIIGGAGSSNQQSHQALFSMLLFWGGLIVTSLSFTESHRTPQNYFYLTLPASTLEKYLAKLLLTSIGFIIISLAGYFLVSLLALVIKLALFKIGQPLFNPFRPEIGQALLNYLIANSVFLFGALFFKRTHFIKTVLALIGFFISLFFFAGIVIILVYFDYFHKGLAGNMYFNTPYYSGPLFGMPFMDSFLGHMSFWGKFFINLIYYTVLILITPLFWILGYIRLKESEARNGV